jgi:uncharacterized damage-inducible protein DinB
MDDLRFPVGRLQRPESLSDTQRAEMTETIAALPARLRAALEGLGEEQLQTPYRPEGWTVRQVVHHLADSHLNAYVRLKLGLTEENPTIKPYEEALWAELPDTAATPVETSLTLLDALHQRWTTLLRAMQPADFSRTVNHPENGRMTLDGLLATYDWHSRHHLAHITSLRQRMGW